MSGFTFEKENVLDARLANEGAKVEMVRGSASIAKNIIAVSGGNASSALSAIQFSVPITSSGLALDTFFYGEYTLQFLVQLGNNGTTVSLNTPLLVPGVNFSMAPYPVSSLMGNSSISINEQQIMSYDVGQYRELLLRMTDTQKLNPDQFCPSLLETSYSHYSDAFLTNSNPSSSYADAVMGTGIVPNGAFPIGFPGTAGAWNINTSQNANAGPNGAGNGLVATANALQNVLVEVTVCEPFLIAPCSWDRLKDADGPAPYYVRSLNITCPINTNANRFFRFNENLALAGGGQLVVKSVTLSGCTKCNLRYTTMQPPLLEGFSLPALSVHHTMSVVTNNIVASRAFANTQNAPLPISLTNQSVTGMPRYIIVGCKKDSRAVPASGGYSYSDASWFFPIQNLTISLGNEQNIMASYSQQDLFTMSRKNGLKIDWITFSGLGQTIGFDATNAPTVGKLVQLCSSPVIIDVRDLKLPYNVVNGSSGNFVFNFNAIALNNETSDGTTFGTSTPMLAVAFLYDSYICTDASTLMTTIKSSFLTPTEPLEPAVIKSEAEIAPDGAVVGGAMHRMRASHAGPTNLSKSAAVARLNKRII